MLLNIILAAVDVLVVQGLLFQTKIQLQEKQPSSFLIPRKSVAVENAFEVKQVKKFSPESASIEALGWPRILKAVQLRCGSSLGAAMVVSEPWLVKNANEAKEAYDQVLEAGKLLKDGIANSRLDAANDFLDGKGGAEAMAGVANTLDALEELVSITAQFKCFECPALSGSDWFKLREAKVRDAFEIDNNGIRSTRLSNTCSSALQEARNQVRRAEEAHKSAVSKFMEESKTHYFEIEQNRVVTAVDRASVSKKKENIRGLSRSGKTAYVEPEKLRKLADALEKAQYAQQQAEDAVLASLWTEVRLLESELRLCLIDAGRLDALRARFRLGNAWRGSVPRVTTVASTDGILALEARHPVLCLDNTQVTPVDLDLAPGRCAILQGANGGGKTQYLGTLGLLALLVKAAIPIPAAQGSIVTFFPTILADVENAAKLTFPNASTYEGFLYFASYALNTEKALILFDELGSGTDSAEGGAIGVAILESLLQKQNAVCAATHHPSVKAQAISRPEAYELWSFEGDSFRPSRGASAIRSAKALDAAERCGLPQDVINVANELLNCEQSDNDDLRSLEPALATLEAVRLRATLAAESAELAAEAAEKMRKEALQAINHAAQRSATRAFSAAQRIEQAEKNLQLLYNDLKKRPDANALTIIGDTLRCARLARKPALRAKREALLAAQGLIVPNSIKPGDSVVIVAFDHAATSISTQPGAQVLSITRNTADLRLGSKLINKVPLTDLAVWDVPILADGSADTIYATTSSYR
uniref:DNA mismatch repair proteins mutS family domain-containing protein n=1 Tax=Aureoumbra lagunensis TaxID=44058 RepID=A0A7S3NJD1_9STRA|eukprot:CAMPEP_0197320522 /NCGR_PEP_ID=MMETSP0891-20130614/60431_1 /TAXON_ID=44058 ORGANISM="Aureoumbra lagunensis, Strain CCMP1510" /NCGR_SAMPLE_ID=MMETSP0891 /ASSEMBLY_ACC=CAM_ASM_000534 /LENGTH=761 /DNA_ID=CAMNT_0042811973 /DNA_START=46 /DNA_END=2331 /DNA_ORIENTATION=+